MAQAARYVKLDGVEPRSIEPWTTAMISNRSGRIWYRILNAPSRTSRICASPNSGTSRPDIGNWATCCARPLILSTKRCPAPTPAKWSARSSMICRFAIAPSVQSTFTRANRTPVASLPSSAPAPPCCLPSPPRRRDAHRLHMPGHPKWSLRGAVQPVGGLRLLHVLLP